MTLIERISITSSQGDSPIWERIASRTKAWAEQRGVFVRDSILLVPIAEHLPLARRAWIHAGGWMPRIETPHTLALGLGPVASPLPGQLSFDASTDRFNANRRLQTIDWAAAWSQRDPRGFSEIVSAFVSTAQTLAKAAASLPPQARSIHWEQGRAALSMTDGTGFQERQLAREALEWAADGPKPLTDALFALQPAAWIAVQAGGPIALFEHVLSEAQNAGLVIDCDPPANDFGFACGHASLATCDGFEHEAQCAAAQVLTHLRDGVVPIALVAADHLLIQRVRALLARHRVTFQDETGWKLSATRSAALIIGLLRAASPTASVDELMDWLKASSKSWPGVENPQQGCSELEAACRRYAWSKVSALNANKLPADAACLWKAASLVRSALDGARQLPLAQWLEKLQSSLQITGAWEGLMASDTGTQVLSALRLNGSSSTGWTWGADLAQTPMSHDEFMTWVDEVLEDASFLPTHASQEHAQVVITPLGRIMLRPFAAVVLPGADGKHLGPSSGANAGLLSELQAVALGLPSAQQTRACEATAFAHAASAPRLSLFYRHMDGSEPQTLSPLVERLVSALKRNGRELTPWSDPRPDLSVVLTPMLRPAPQAGELLPAQLSASACEALRACPYRFFARHMLRLREIPELDDQVEKRDYGNWLHTVLLAFHEKRAAPDLIKVETAQLIALGQALQVQQGLADTDFLPFAVSFSQFAPRYIAWLHERDAQGAHWFEGEKEYRIRPPELHGVELYGRIDRVDKVSEAQGDTIELIDYKTGRIEGLRQQVKQPLEDTQLAFYAALMQAHEAANLRAFYLALDDAKGIETVRHPDVHDSAEALIQGLAQDLTRIRQGAGMPALGEGRTCEHCEARGLCRRDHWAGIEVTK